MTTRDTHTNEQRTLTVTRLHWLLQAMRQRLGRFAARLRQNLNNRPARELAVAVALFAALLFISPLLHWWANDARTWYVPYLLWGLIIALIYFLQRQQAP